MSLVGALSIATSGLDAAQEQIAVVSQNVANANTAGYVAETAANIEVSAAGQPDGVVVGAATRVTSPALQTGLWQQNAVVSQSSTLSTAWSGIIATLGSTSSDSGSTGSLTAAIDGVQTALTTLQADPTDPTGQEGVVSASGMLATTFNGIAATLSDARQTAETSIGDDLATANQALSAIGSLSSQIVQFRAEGVSTASLEDQRDAAMTDLSNTMSVRFTETSNGNVLVRTASGIQLPTDPAGNALSMAPMTLAATDSTPSTIPGIMLDGTDITGALSGGTLGAHLTLRDTTIPTAQAALDGTAAATAQRFSAQGLALFTDANGAVPGSSPTSASPAGQIGFASVMQVNPAVTADPSLVSTGTASPASSAVLADVATYALGEDQSPGVAQPSPPTSGLGPAGTLSLGYQAGGSIADMTAQMLASWGSSADAASGNLANATATQTALTNAIDTTTGVSVDGELSKMVALQNSYAANAKVIAGVQTMFTALLASVDP